MCPSSRRPITAAEDSIFRPAFEILDADHDGKISRDDLRAFYSTALVDASDDEIISMISAADSDNDGFVAYEEFERVLRRRRDQTSASVVSGDIFAEAFRVMDRDGDGRVGYEDLKAYLEMAGIDVNDEDVEAMIRMGDGDLATGVGLDDLLKILAVGFF